MIPFAGTFIAYKALVADELVKRYRYPSPEWLDGQMARLMAAYDLGEPAELIAETLAMFALGARKAKTPLQLAVRHVRF